MNRRNLFKNLGFLVGGLSIVANSEAALIAKSPKRVLPIAHITDVPIQPNKIATNGF